ncbi:hypothetical protein AA303_08255 [Pseudomonas psychrophila]|nr:hypothetical protein AA303_08255 [Pseudomonas psychrophila]
MTLNKGTEADQRDAVFAMQGLGDFFKHGIEYAVGLFFGEVGLFSNSGGEIWFTHDEASLTVFCCYVRAALYGAAPKAPQALNCGRPV